LFTGVLAGPVSLAPDGPSGAIDIAHDALVVAVGRQARSSGLGLHHAGIDVDARGFVTVDRRLRTTNARVWAAGDVTTMPQFTHLAGVHASVASAHAVLGLRRAVDLSAVTRVTFTDPEVAAVGAATWSVTGDTARVVTWRHTDVDRAVAEGRTDGLTRLALGRHGKVIGATIVSPRAGEYLAKVTLAVKHGPTATNLVAATHPYPTYGDGVWNAVISVFEDRLARPGARRVTGALVSALRAPREPTTRSDLARH